MYVHIHIHIHIYIHTLTGSTQYANITAIYIAFLIHYIYIYISITSGHCKVVHELGLCLQPVMKKICWPYFDPEFANLPERINGPICRVCIDNETLEDCTIVKVNSVKKQGLLLEVVQILTDVNLIISKGYISSDGGWFMDVFHVKDEHGNKLTDPNVINYIQQAIGSTRDIPNPAKAKPYTQNDVDLLSLPSSSSSISSSSSFEHRDPAEATAIEMTGTDRPGLFSEISAALADLRCNVVEAHAWSHNARLACVAYISDQSTHTPIDDPRRLASIEDHLTTVLRATTADDASSGIHFNPDEVKTAEFQAPGDGSHANVVSNVERRLHQLMLSVRDFDGPCGPTKSLSSKAEVAAECNNDQEARNNRTVVFVDNCKERRYSIVNVECKDRPRLMFDTVCTLIDMHYVIFHASVHSHGGYAFQEYFIRHMDGRALDTESEKERVTKCLEAAIERRVCEGVRLELCAENRVGLLSDITRVLRENGLTVVRADVATQGEKAVNAFYLRDISGNKIDMEFVESVKKEMGGPIQVAVKNDFVNNSSATPNSSPERSRFSLGGMLKSQIERFSHNFIPIK